MVGGGPAGLAVVVLTIRHQRDLAAAADGAAIHFRNQCHIQTTPFSYCLYFTTGNAICKTHHFHLKHESFSYIKHCIQSESTGRGRPLVKQYKRRKERSKGRFSEAAYIPERGRGGGNCKYSGTRATVSIAGRGTEHSWRKKSGAVGSMEGGEPGGSADLRRKKRWKQRCWGRKYVEKIAGCGEGVVYR